MKIIDNKKDYYDYLVSVWGLDEQIVYDRRGSEIPKLSYDRQHWIQECDSRLQYVLTIGNTKYTITYNDKPNGWFFSKGYIPTSVKNWFIKKDIIDNKSSQPLHLLIGSQEKHYWDYNIKLWESNKPLLRNIPIITKLISPDTLWRGIYEYLSSLKDKDINDTRTDIQKLESAGFDKKSSFRNIK